MEFYRNCLCICCIVAVISLGIVKTWAKNTSFDKFNVLKIIVLPSNVRFFRRHILKTFSIPIISVLKFCSSSIYLSICSNLPILNGRLSFWEVVSSPPVWSRNLSFWGKRTNFQFFCKHSNMYRKLLRLLLF